MKLENQVCLPIQGERLKELGVIQESLFYWTHSEKWGIMPKRSIDFSGNPTSVFSVAELGIMLPHHLRDEQERNNPHLRIYRGAEDWSAEYHQTFNRPFLWSGNNKHLVNALADLLIKVLERSPTTVEQVNQRLING